MADRQVLKDHRTKLIKGLTLPVIKNLLDDLTEERVLNKDEADSIQEEKSARADKARSLIDSVEKTGSTASRIMLEKLKIHDPHLYNDLDLDKHLQPALKRPAPGAPGGPPITSTVPNCSDQETEEEYRMDSRPRGLCVIINNMKFKNPKKNLDVSEHDEEALKKVFEFLGFEVKIHRDLKAEEMKELMLDYSTEGSHGDCFVCCLLSHGSKKGVCGVDMKLCTMKDILSPFEGKNCHALVGKPKVFFIQACRGSNREEKVVVTADDAAEADDAPGESYTIASRSDFLVSMSTVEDYVSHGDDGGSWFFQSLCPRLEEGSQRGEDILTILTKVNDEVSRKEGVKKVKERSLFCWTTEKNIDLKMTPEPRFTLRKKLIFRVPSSSV